MSRFTFKSLIKTLSNSEMVKVDVTVDGDKAMFTGTFAEANDPQKIVVKVELPECTPLQASF